MSLGFCIGLLSCPVDNTGGGDVANSPGGDRREMHVPVSFGNFFYEDVWFGFVECVFQKGTERGGRYFGRNLPGADDGPFELETAGAVSEAGLKFSVPHSQTLVHNLGGSNVT